MIDDILERLGLKYEDLSREERATVNKWISDLTKSELTIPVVRKYIIEMKESVENELSNSDLNSKQDIFLKARLRNYLLLKALLDSPTKAKKALEAQLEGLKLDRK
jgi:hypothetical protein